MRTFQDYLLESHEESKEEKSGIDFDHDKERGEPEAHKAKVMNKQKEMLEFFEARKKGAAKIASEAHSKGGASILTYWHFRAKDRPYREVIAAIKSGKNESYFRSKYRSFAQQLHSDKLKQEKFQEVIGQAEVWGEAISQLFN